MPTRSIKKVLIANRGEIALRISKTLKRMKIKSVGICIPNERHAHSFSLCEQMISLDRNDLSCYLDIEAILAIAKNTKVDAIHPGYGFLSENSKFAKACEEAGILFIGPTSTMIESMGNKNTAKELAKNCKIPVLETIVESREDDPSFESIIKKLSLPIIVKPLSGGGGKGMTTLRQWNTLSQDLTQARSVAKKAFGDSRLLAEPLIEHARHIEIQVIGDQFGSIRHLYERDCTIQRRHQKIIEETPSPIVHSSKLDQILKDAVLLCESLSYQSLGTVEFILDQNENYYFMEMNTRLQVEHSVTEMTVGLDLVEKQIQIANGKKLATILPKQIKRKYHTIEARIYTENPKQEFLPSTGKIEYLKTPKESKSIRVDCGIEKGQKIDHTFDPMIMKITTSGSSRTQAIERLLQALRHTIVFGVQTNIDYVQWVLQQPDFLNANHFTTWTSQTLSVFQNQPSLDHVYKELITEFELEKMKRENEWSQDPWLTVNHKSHGLVWKNEKYKIVDELKNTIHEGYVMEANEGYWISYDGIIDFIKKEFRSFDEDEISTSNQIVAPMTGTIIKVYVTEGTNVKKNDVLIEMDAMKMQYKILSVRDGVIAKILCSEKDIVQYESTLIELEDGK